MLAPHRGALFLINFFFLMIQFHSVNMVRVSHLRSSSIGRTPIVLRAGQSNSCSCWAILFLLLLGYLVGGVEPTKLRGLQNFINYKASNLCRMEKKSVNYSGPPFRKSRIVILRGCTFRAESFLSKLCHYLFAM